MEFSQEIYEAHGKLSRCSVEFIEFMRDNQDGLRRSHFDTIVNHPIFNYYRLQPWPTFVNQEAKKELKVVCLKVLNLLKSIPERIFNYDFDRIGDYYEIDAARCRELFKGVDNDHLDRMLGRGDFVISPRQGIKCIEYNMASNLGGWEQDFLEEIYTGIPAISRFLTEHNVRLRRSHFFVNMMAHALESAVERYGSNPEGEINTVLMGEESVDRSGAESGQGVMKPVGDQLVQMYKQALRSIDNSLEGDLIFCNFNELESVNKSIRCRGKNIHVIIECSRGNVPARVMEVFARGSFLMYNGPVVEVMTNKLNISLLSEHEDSDLFSQREREIIKEHIPWTRKLTPGYTTYEGEKIKLEDFVISHRERLTLKSARGYGGYEVSMGAQLDAGQWKQCVENALAEKNWVAQEYIKPYSYIYQADETGCVPHQVVWGVFMFGRRDPGGFVRVLPEKSSSRIINLNQGAEQSIIMEVEE